MKAQEEQIKNLNHQQAQLQDQLKAESTFLGGLVTKNHPENEPQELEKLSLKELQIKTNVMLEILQQQLEDKTQEIRDLTNSKEDLESQLFKHSSRLAHLVFDQDSSENRGLIEEEEIEGDSHKPSREKSVGNIENLDTLDEKVEDYFDLTQSQIQTKNKSIDQLTQHKEVADKQIMHEKRFLFTLQDYRDPMFDPSEQSKEDQEDLSEYLEGMTFDELNGKIKDMVEAFRKQLKEKDEQINKEKSALNQFISGLVQDETSESPRKLKAMNFEDLNKRIDDLIKT